MESLYDYGSRAGFWRLHRLITSRRLPCTVFACGMALERNPEAVRAMADANWEVASHGYRWIDYQEVDEATERKHIARTVQVHEALFGKAPVGMYQGKPNVNTRRFVVELGNFLYDSDSYADDLPYWNFESGKPHLIVPYTLTENDMRFATPNGFSTGDEFFHFLRDSLDYLVQEGKDGAPKMMSVGLHCRLVGHPGRAAGLAKFLDHVDKQKSDVWVCTREEIARHWYTNHYPAGHGSPPAHAC
ncbi:hypothetical protein T492DRAFT_1052378 [Pavlovales sp. CCMP2436]|nr:hypothetical protein T492DRAFT_1052378 [Pavlovales sp. CCMP2436]